MPRTFARVARRAPAALTVAVLLTPLDASADDAPVTTTSTTPEPERLTGRMIADRIHERLRADPAVDAEQIGVVVVDGEVTISGGVPSLEVKQRAERVAESVVGVRSVRNRLRVLVSTPHTDRQLTHYVERALRSDPATSALELKVSTTNGVVTLRGEVPSLAEKQLAEQIAADLFAVRAVRNRVTVAAPSDTREAAEIAADVRAALEWDARLAGQRVAVRVEERTVVLEGAVESAAARRHAIEDAWVRGVTAVKADGLVVDRARARSVGDSVNERDARAEKRDEALRRAVLTSFENHPRLAGANVEVSVDAAGRVTLRGVVDSLKAKRTAGELVRGRLGVRDVRNRLFVDPTFVPAAPALVGDASLPAAADEDAADDDAVDEAAANADGTSAMLAEANVEEPTAPEPRAPVDDTALARELREALRRDAYLSARRLDVDVIRGHAYLAGEVTTPFERARAEDVAARLRGVVTIHNEIVVERAPPEGEGGGALGAEPTRALYEWSDS